MLTNNFNFFAFYTIFQTHKWTENAHPKNLKDVGVMVFTIILILFLGGDCGNAGEFLCPPEFWGGCGLGQRNFGEFHIWVYG